MTNGINVLDSVPVLDDGYVELIGFLGDDDAPIDAARVSFDKKASSYTKEQNDKLYAYLMEHNHTTPLEMVTFKWRIRAPVVVWWQWVRHRHACIDGDTSVWFDLPSGLSDNGITGAKKYSMTIAEIYRKFTKSTYMKNRISGMQLRSCIDGTKQIYRTTIKDVWKTGDKPTYRVTTKSGYEIVCTPDHRFMSESGWGTLADIISMHVSDGDLSKFTWKPCKLAVNGVDKSIPLYRDYEWLAARRNKNMYLSEIAEEAGCSTHTIRKWLRKYRLQFTKKDIVRKSAITQKGSRRGSSAATKEGSRKALETKKLRGSMPRGASHHWWKGGMSSERTLVSAWTSRQAPDVHKKFNYRCVCCGGAGRLIAHHLDPIWNSPALGMEFSNLVSMCASCHRNIHAKNCELDFKKWVDSGGVVGSFEATRKPITRKLPTATKLHVHFDDIANVEYAGLRETYDMEVAGPWHNYIANGFVVHNSYNFVSGRYVPFDETDCYTPTNWRIQSASNKQGSEQGKFLDVAKAAIFNQRRDILYEEAFKLYDDMLQAGVAKEQARLVLPFAAMYYDAIFQANARSLKNFIDLRIDNHAQWEIQQYARAMLYILRKTHPRIFPPEDHSSSS